MKTNLEEQKLFGKVASIATQTQNEYKNYHFERYNQSGFLMSETNFAKAEFPDKTYILLDKGVITCEYDSKDRIVSTNTHWDGNNFDHRQNSLYEGNTCTITEFIGERLDNVIKNIFDQNGRNLELYYFKDNEQKELIYKRTAEYKNDRLIRFLAFAYDEDMLEVVHDSEKFFEYDEHGNILHETKIILDEPSSEKRIESYYTYGDSTLHGNIMQKTVINRSDSADEKRMDYRYTYTFDSCGNWLTKTEHGESDIITQRVITYWD